jgi:hypothetical protein
LAPLPLRRGAFLLRQKACHRRLPDRRRRPWSHSQTDPLSLIVRRGLLLILPAPRGGRAWRAPLYPWAGPF